MLPLARCCQNQSALPGSTGFSGIVTSNEFDILSLTNPSKRAKLQFTGGEDTVINLATIGPSGGDFKADGSVPMTGDIQMGGNHIENCNTITVNMITVGNATITDAVIPTLTSSTATITNLTTTSAVIPTLTGSTATITNLTTTSAVIPTLTSSTATITNLTTTSAIIPSLTSSTATITNLTTTSAFIPTLTSSTATITNLTTTSAVIPTLTGSTATITNLTTSSAVIPTLTSSTATITNLTTTSAVIPTLTGSTATITNLTTTNLTTTNLDVRYVGENISTNLIQFKNIALLTAFNAGLVTYAFPNSNWLNVTRQMTSGLLQSASQATIPTVSPFDHLVRINKTRARISARVSVNVDYTGGGNSRGVEFGIGKNLATPIAPNTAILPQGNDGERTCHIWGDFDLSANDTLSLWARRVEGTRNQVAITLVSINLEEQLGFWF